MEEKILKELKKQTIWLRFLALPSFKLAIRDNIKTDEQRKIFELTDGNMSTVEIAKLLKSKGIKISHMTVYNYWRRWYALGLVEPSETYSGRYKRIVELIDL